MFDFDIVSMVKYILVFLGFYISGYFVVDGYFEYKVYMTFDQKPEDKRTGISAKISIGISSIIIFLNFLYKSKFFN